ncbi:MAG: CHASE2 domain-containing protein [Pseudomonadota bacterium]
MGDALIKQLKIGTQTRTGVILGALVITLALALAQPGRDLDNLVTDCFFALRGPATPCGDTLIVAIDEPSFGVIRQQWPWPRGLHARLIDSLYRAGAARVALDIILAEPSDPGQDALLADALKRHPGTVLATHFDQAENDRFMRETLVTPLPDLAGPETRTGFINLPLNRSWMIRTAALKAGTSSSLAMETVRGRVSPKDLPEKETITINYLGPPGTLETVSYYQALDPELYFPPDLVRNRLVFVGFVASNADISQTIPDHFPVPWSRWGNAYMSGVEIHTTIADNLVTGTWIREVPMGYTLGLGLLVWTMAGFIMTRESQKPLMVFWGLGSVLLVSVSFALFARMNLLVSTSQVLGPLTAMTWAALALQYFETTREKRFIRRAFSTYVAPQVVKDLMDHPEKLVLGGEQREITAFFSDIQGFTTISESLTPRELVALLNEFLSEMSQIILAHQGTVDKFEGDAIIAFFGAPQPMAGHARRACCAAIDMRRRLADLNRGWEKRGMPVLRMRIGLCTGPAIVGNMGSFARMDYTMMGDTVNTAARLEGANKAYGIYSLISRTTREALDPEITVREIDTIQVKGKIQGLTVYQIMDYSRDLAPAVKDLISAYALGLDLYRNRKFREAGESFARALALDPLDGPSRTLLERCRTFSSAPPAPDWTGVHHLDSK